MKTRESIIDDFNRSEEGKDQTNVGIAAILVVLLDIRDLLSKENGGGSAGTVGTSSPLYSHENNTPSLR